MISKVLKHLQRSPTGAACASVLLAGVLAPGAVLGQAPPTITIPGGGGYAIPQSSVPSVPISPYYQSAAPPWGQGEFRPDLQTGFGGNFSPGSKTCLPGRMLSGIVASDDREVILRFGRDSLYRVRLSKACPALLMSGASVAGVTRSTGGIICDAYDVQLKVVAGDGSVSHCAAASLHRMTTAQIQAASGPTQP